MKKRYSEVNIKRSMVIITTQSKSTVRGSFTMDNVSVLDFVIFPWPVSRECYRRSLAVSSTTISYAVYVVILGVCLRFKPHWMFQIYKYVIKGHEE